MHTNTSPRHFSRTQPAAAFSALTLLSLAGLASPAVADNWVWNAGNGLWNNPANWSPFGVPGSPIATDYVRIGNLAIAHNASVLYQLPGPNFNGSVTELHLSNGVSFDTNGFELSTYSNTGTSLTLSGAGTRMRVRPSPGINGFQLLTNGANLGAGTQLEFIDGGVMRTRSVLSEGLVSGRGRIDLLADSVFDNNGVIAGSNNGGLTVRSLAPSAEIDVDGNFGDGELSLTAPFSQLTFEGTEFTEPFSGTVFMGSGSLLTMNMSNGWEADAWSEFNVASGVAGAAAQIAGGQFTFGGELNIGGTHGHLRVLADTTVADTAEVFLGDNDRLEFDGDTIIEGGLFNLSLGARVDFDGPTEIIGGTFDMVGDFSWQGALYFNGDTQWRGVTTINGFARQVGDALITSSTTINANVFDMDGNGDAAWTINHSLTVNTQVIEGGSQIFDGTINMNVGLLGRLTVNLADPAAAWTMSGTMNLAGLGALTPTRISGSRMIVTEDLVMGSGIAQITADAAFQGASVSIAGNGFLRMRGDTTVDAATVFSGAGTLQNGLDGSMMLETGVSLNQVGLINNSVLGIGQAGPGIASVDRFSSTSTAVMNIDLGGYVAGTEHDLLLVTTGAATLGGELNVDLQAVGGGQTFAPTIGDEFTIISALGGISGTFANSPTTQVGNLRYEWTVIYNPNTVVLSLDHIERIPECGCAADYNQDGGINGEDVEAFFIDFENAAGCSDINQDGGVNGEDVEAFFVVFENGGC